uniref:Guanine nucleotide-binding protein subunit gamma n=1 Tax=Ciona intestinalis TaxID=7719 RepID=H2XQR3_CIOIN
MATRSVRELEKQIEELRYEANTERVKVSQSCKELMDYCESHASQDYFLYKTDKTNPFKESRSPCVVL